MKRVALITGVTGQDGSYLAEFLLAKDYVVHGVVRRASSFNRERIEHLHLGDERATDFHLHYGDMGDAGALRELVENVRPDEVYNLAAQSHVRVSFDQPEYTVDVTGLGVLRLLEAVRSHERRAGRRVRFYQAGSSEMFGAARPRQNESTRFEPRSPYACAKVYAHAQVESHRSAYGMFAVNGILFNHESPRRGEAFLTRKITRAATRIKLGLATEVALGNLDARRDWGFAGEYVEAMWLMLQQDVPRDFCIATGVSHSVRDFLELAFGALDLDWRAHVRHDPRHLRPSEVPHLEGDAARARAELGWEARTDLRGLVDLMLESDLRLAERELVLREAGHAVPPPPGG